MNLLSMAEESYPVKSIERSSPLTYTKCTNIFQATFCSMHHSLDSTALDKNKEGGMFGILKRSEDSVPDAEPVSDSSAASCDHDPSHRHEFLSHNVPLEVGGEEFREHPLVASKQVSFGDLEIRKYAVILGDHPECCMGPPVTIDWLPFKSKCVSIDSYESKRGTRRSLNELKMGWIQRKQALRKVDGATDEEMRQAACEAQRIRDQRSRTLKHLRYECVQLPLESVTRKVKRAFDRRK